MNTNMKFKTIAVATDLSNATSSALRYALAIARLHGSTLVVVHVVDPLGYAFPNGAPSSLVAFQAAREELAKIESGAHDHGVPVHSVVETGVVFERILQAVIDHHADLLVLGTRAKSKAGRVALGTVARQLLAKAPCPIMAISPDVDATLAYAGRWPCVLAAADFSAPSLSALQTAHQMAHSQLVALHVSRATGGHSCSNCLERLRFLTPFNESHTVPVEHIVAAGEPGQLITEYAQQFHADLVVLGSPENELTEEDFPSSTVLEVISNVTCPVLCVPPLKKTPYIEAIEEEAVKC